MRSTRARCRPGPTNPAFNAFVMEETALATEREAQRDMNLASARRWLVVNPDARTLSASRPRTCSRPGDNSVPYLHADSPIRRRAGFVNHHFWATMFNPSELHAAGDYPNQSEPGEGLPKWTAGNRALERQDVVAWYTFGITHVPRPEEWPMMSATMAGFKLLPVSFFSRNPALDVPGAGREQSARRRTTRDRGRRVALRDRLRQIALIELQPRPTSRTADSSSVAAPERASRSTTGWRRARLVTRNAAADGMRAIVDAIGNPAA